MKFEKRPAGSQYSLEIEIEATGIHASESPLGTCPNYNPILANLSGPANAYAATAFSGTVQRLAPLIQGLNVTTTTVLAMLDLCSCKLQFVQIYFSNA